MSSGVALRPECGQGQYANFCHSISNQVCLLPVDVVNLQQGRVNSKSLFAVSSPSNRSCSLHFIMVCYYREPHSSGWGILSFFCIVAVDASALMPYLHCCISRWAMQAGHEVSTICLLMVIRAKVPSILVPSSYYSFGFNAALNLQSNDMCFSVLS